MCNPPPPPRGSMAPLKSKKLNVSGVINIAKSIEGGSIKLTTLVDYMYMCAVTNAYFCNGCIFF